MPVEKEITGSCQPLQVPDRNYSHRDWGGRAADPFPPLKFRDSKQSSRQLERNGEETWVRPDIHDIALWVEGVWSEISEALNSSERQEDSDQRAGRQGPGQGTNHEDSHWPGQWSQSSTVS